MKSSFLIVLFSSFVSTGLVAACAEGPTYIATDKVNQMDLEAMPRAELIDLMTELKAQMHELRDQKSKHENLDKEAVAQLNYKISETAQLVTKVSDVLRSRQEEKPGAIQDNRRGH